MGEISIGKSSRAEKNDFGNVDDDKNINPDTAHKKKKTKKKKEEITSTKLIADLLWLKNSTWEDYRLA